MWLKGVWLRRGVVRKKGVIKKKVWLIRGVVNKDVLNKGCG